LESFASKIGIEYAVSEAILQQGQDGGKRQIREFCSKNRNRESCRRSHFAAGTGRGDVGDWRVD